MTQAQTLKHIITSRKSVYPPEYSDTPIPEEVLQETISSANEAPNHKRTKENVPAESFSEIKMNEIAKKVAKSYAVVTISVHFSGKVAEWEEIAATAIAVQNMYLTCTAHAVGCYWGTPGFMFQLKDFLQLEENEHCYGLFFMGMKK